tara:strand:- start:10642 stop:11313 length:672 start_codon:yes stop_codon:yes gene_type:complete
MFHITPKSKNAKVGKMAVTTSTATTCPSACPFRDNGCYAESGPLKLHWLKVTKGERGDDWPTFLGKIKDLPAGSKWRHNQAGDLPGDTKDLDSTKCVELAKANEGKRGFTYTHYDVLDNFQNAITVNMMNHLGFTVNVSANNLEHADQLCDLDIAPVATVLPIEQTTNTVTPKGRKVVVCPATYKEDVSCASCMLCEKWDRNVVVGFPAHGTSKKKASVVASN